jgi:hypothetical protein
MKIKETLLGLKLMHLGVIYKMEIIFYNLGILLKL